MKEENQSLLMHNNTSKLLEIAWNIREYGSIVCFLLGLLMNSLLIGFFSRKKQLYHSSLSIYIIGLCISNQFKLLFELPFDLFLNDEWTDTFCQFYSWGRITFGEIFSWILVFLALDRIVIFREHNITEIYVFNKSKLVTRVFLLIFIFLLMITKNFIVILLNLLNRFSFFYLFEIKICYGYTNNNYLSEMIYWYDFSKFYLGYQIIYCYLPILLLIIFNLFILFTIYELMYCPLLGSSAQRDLKIKQVKSNESIIIMFTLLFIITNLPHQMFKTLVNFLDKEIKNQMLDSISLLLNLLELLLVFMYFFLILCHFKKLRSFLRNFLFFSSRKKSLNLEVMNNNYETNL